MYLELTQQKVYSKFIREPVSESNNHNGLPLQPSDHMYIAYNWTKEPNLTLFGKFDKFLSILDKILSPLSDLY